MKNKIKIVHLVLICLLISCNQKNNKESKNNSTFQRTTEVFENKLENKPKLFSKFWNDMSIIEFEKTISILKKEDKIKESNDSLFYEIYGSSMYLEGFFHENKLKKIVLKRWIEWAPYDIFKEKYKLPALIKTNKYYQQKTVPNWDYSPIYYVFLENNSAETVPSCLIDNNSSGHTRFKRNDMWDKRLGLSKKTLIADKGGNTIVIFEEAPSMGIYGEPKDGLDLIYSLLDWKHEIPQQIKNKYKISPGVLNDISIVDDGYKNFKNQKEGESIGNYLIRKNSKYVTKSYYQNFDLKITYTTQEYYNRENRLQIEKKKNRKKLEQRMKELEENSWKIKKKEALNEI